MKWVLTISFLMGFIIDVFSDTPGVNALSCTVLAMLRRPVFKLYTGGDEAFDEVLPCISSLGPAMYAKYMISCTLLYCLLCFSLIYFTFIAFGGLLLKVLASTVLSAALLMGIDGMVGGPRRS